MTRKRIKLLDFGREYTQLRTELLPLLREVLREGRFILGPDLLRFEQQFARFCGVSHAVGVANGTAALHLALRALDIGPGDEVITTALSFNATAQAIVYAGATPVFVDVDPGTLSIDPERVAAAVTPRTKAILPVHLYGIPAPMRELMTIAMQQHLLIVEDCAQAHGATYDGRAVGGFGMAGCFSFMPAKNLGAYGDAGAVVMNDERLDARLRRLRNHGRTTKYIHEELGFAERLDNLQAAILGLKLRHLKQWNSRRRVIARRYDRAFRGTAVTPLTVPSGRVSSYYTYVLRTADRDGLMQYLERAGIETHIYYPVPMHLQPVFAGLGYTSGSLPVVEQAVKEIISIPVHQYMTDAETEYVIRTIQSYGR